MALKIIDFKNEKEQIEISKIPRQQNVIIENVEFHVLEADDFIRPLRDGLLQKPLQIGRVVKVDLKILPIFKIIFTRKNMRFLLFLK